MLSLLSHKLLPGFFFLILILPHSAYSINYIYDTDNRLIQVVLDNGENILYLYDKVGNREAVIQGNVQFIDLTTQLSIKASSLIKIEPGIWERTITLKLKNISGSLLQSRPLIILINQLPDSVSLLNAHGYYQNIPFFLLDNNGKISQKLQFRALSENEVSYSISLYAVQKD